MLYRKVPFIEKHLHHNPVTFSRDEDSIVIFRSTCSKTIKLCGHSYSKNCQQYAKACDIAMKHFHLMIDSNLDDSNGHKYGLGSSAAVLVSVMKH